MQEGREEKRILSMIRIIISIYGFGDLRDDKDSVRRLRAVNTIAWVFIIPYAL